MRIRLHFSEPKGGQKTERRYGAVRRYIMQVVGRKETVTVDDFEFRLGYGRARQNLIELKNEGKLRVVRPSAVGRNARRSPAQYALA